MMITANNRLEREAAKVAPLKRNVIYSFIGKQRTLRQPFGMDHETLRKIQSKAILPGKS
ncbi:MAG TPA: hypothetical protein VLK23_09855 [Thermodesulfobacteriota bacterium]|nr:hypothetical protein [Thermodesulfobacteriota bacterium]